MLSLRTHAVIGLVAAVLLTSCGGSDEPSDPPETPSASESSEVGSPSPTAEPTDNPSDKPTQGDQGGQGDNGPDVAREPFCAGIAPATVAAALGLGDVQVLTDVEPGDEIQAAPGSAGVLSNEWTCTIGQTSGSSIAATWTMRDTKATRNDVTAQLTGVRGTLGAENCEAVTDEALGEGTQGIDCSRTSTGSGSTAIGFTMAARAVVIDGTQLECYLASTDPDDLTDLSAAAPEVCGLVLDLVLG